MRVKQQVASINLQQPPIRQPAPAATSDKAEVESTPNQETNAENPMAPASTRAYEHAQVQSAEDADLAFEPEEMVHSKSAADHVTPGLKVWKVRDVNLKLSALEATVAAKTGLLKYDDLEVYKAPSQEPVDQGPADPLSGGLSAVLGTLGSVAQRAGDYPLLLAKLLEAKEDGQAEHEIAEFAKDTGKGVTGLGGAVLKAPMDITHNVSRGFHNLPKMYGDETVRPLERVTDVQSGLQAAGKNLGFGLWDGVSGLVTQPMKGAQEGGWMGGLLGLGKGIGGVVFKPAAGVIGIPGYVSKGIYEEIRTTQTPVSGKDIIEAQMVQGFRAWEAATEAERQGVFLHVRRELEDLQTLEG